MLLNGIQKSVETAEYKYKRIVRTDLSEKHTEKFSTVLQQINKNTRIKIECFITDIK